MDLKEKYTQDDLSDEHLEELTAKLLVENFREQTKQRYRESLEENFNIKRDDKPRGRRISLPIILAIAASFLLLIYAISVLRPATIAAPELADSYLVNHFENSKNLKGPADISQLRSDAIAAYASKNFEESARLRKEILASPDAEVEDQFHLGLSLLYQTPPKTAEAIATFDTILKDDSSVSDEEARWFLALALLKADRVDEAKTTLNMIISEETWNASAAQNILNSLK